MSVFTIFIISQDEICKLTCDAHENESLDFYFQCSFWDFFYLFTAHYYNDFGFEYAKTFNIINIK